MKKGGTVVFSVVMLFSACLMPANADDLTVNHNDDIARLFHDKPVYCLYCGELHTGFGGSFVQFFHEIAYFFGGLFGAYPGQGHMYFTSETLEIGADEPFYFIHAGDTHVGFIDERDSGDARLVETAKRRDRDWPAALKVLDDLSFKAKELDAFIVHTGDLIDFVSQKNLDIAADFTAENDVFASAGNHEFHVYIWDDGDVAALRDRVAPQVQASFTNDIRFSVRKEHGVKFIAIDNSFHKIEQWQLDRFKAELADGMPIILAMHVPVYAPDIFEFQMKKYDYPHPAWLMAVPEELMQEYNYEDSWIEEQKANDATNEFYELITTSPLIKAIVTGHDHAHFVSQVTPALKQYMVATDEGQIFEVR